MNNNEPNSKKIKVDMTKKNSSWKNMDIISVQQFDTEKLQHVLDVADSMKEKVACGKQCDLLKGKILANVFYEPSTRTSCSFQAAMIRLGGSVICVNESSSSVKKGESLSDTMKSLECYSDIIVLRHPFKGSAAIAAEATSIPILNAGDGVGEHPTQALLDLYTISSELRVPLNKLKGKVVTMVGDLKNGRTVHSLAKLLAPLQVKLNYVSPESLKMPSYILSEIETAGGNQVETSSLLDVLGSSDVVYVTRIQKERFATEEEYNDVKDSFCITAEILRQAKDNMVLMHPLPRVNEIACEVDADPRAAYFRQMKNGLYVRMALLALVLGVL